MEVLSNHQQLDNINRTTANDLVNSKEPSIPSIPDVGNDSTSTTFTPIITPTEVTKWVTLDFKLKDWPYMNFSKTVLSSTLLSCIKNMLHERHGWIHNLRLFKDSVREGNELMDDTKSLSEYDIEGVCTGKDFEDVERNAGGNVPRRVICYDFTPYQIRDSDRPDPILLSWMND